MNISDKEELLYDFLRWYIHDSNYCDVDLSIEYICDEYIRLKIHNDN